MAKVEFINENIIVETEIGTTVLTAAINAGLHPDAPCGGVGKCGKCLAKLDGKIIKSCQTKITGDCKVEFIDQTEGARILTEGMSREVAFLPGLKIVPVKLTKPRVGEKLSDWQRLLNEIKEQDSSLPTENFLPDPVLAGSLFEKRKEGEDWYAICTHRRIMELRRDSGIICFAAFDIGTTTVAGYLLNAITGETLSIESRMNPQTSYGADVIMRANYALAHGTEELSTCIRATISEMLQALAVKAGVDTKDIFQISIVGNTCMHHLFLGIFPGSLVHAPYTPAFSHSLVLKATDYDLPLHPNAELLFLPDIAGYVGADTCGCLLALRQDQKEEITLMLDIGTNGEMILGNKDKLVTCSTAAGPAFEGAKIECGMRGAAGAVDHVKYQDGKWSYTTVDNKPAIGICGSGLIDLVAELCRNGFLEDSGRMNSGQENPSVFMLVKPEDAGNENGVYLTQKDIGEVQLAKAAIAAGIALLMKELNITEKDISSVYIAGAFGNYMDPVNAGRIGMFPESLTEKVKGVGNAAGQGAKIALINTNEWQQIDSMAENVNFIELAGLPDFQDYFVDELEFIV